MSRVKRARSLRAVVGCGVLLLTAGAMGGTAVAAPAASHHRVRTVYVSTTGKDASTCGATWTSACATVDQGIANARGGDRVRVEPGVYKQQVVVDKRVVLVGGGGAVIDATGLSSGSGSSMDAAGIMVVGAASGSVVRGFSVHGATGEGILVLGARDVTIAANDVSGNDLGTPATTKYLECQPAGNVPGDCGEGIHLMSSVGSTVVGNRVSGNSGGILMTDEFGPSAHNRIIRNVVENNLYDCGITIPSHSTKAVSADGTLDPAAGGVYDNIVSHNLVVGNGTLGDGAGVLLAAAAPGGASYDNRITANTILGNGMAGVTIHSHFPNQDLNGNVIIGNRIGVNNVAGDPDAKVFTTTGILVSTVSSPVTVRITNNRIWGDVTPRVFIGAVTVKR